MNIPGTTSNSLSYYRNIELMRLRQIIYIYRHARNL